jgi:(p)ppGpp synthase/HD superfamily hydrolase
LHDVLEDTDAERSELEARFGPEVAELVALVSDARRSTMKSSARMTSASA